MTILTSIALILIGVYANLPHAISIVLYVFSCQRPTARVCVAVYAIHAHAAKVKQRNVRCILWINF